MITISIAAILTFLLMWATSDLKTAVLCFLVISGIIGLMGAGLWIEETYLGTLP